MVNGPQLPAYRVEKDNLHAAVVRNCYVIGKIGSLDADEPPVLHDS